MLDEPAVRNGLRLLATAREQRDKHPRNHSTNSAPAPRFAHAHSSSQRRQPEAGRGYKIIATNQNRLMREIFFPFCRTPVGACTTGLGSLPPVQAPPAFGGSDRTHPDPACMNANDATARASRIRARVLAVRSCLILRARCAVGFCVYGEMPTAVLSRASSARASSPGMTGWSRSVPA